MNQKGTFVHVIYDGAKKKKKKKKKKKNLKRKKCTVFEVSFFHVENGVLKD